MGAMAESRLVDDVDSILAPFNLRKDTAPVRLDVGTKPAVLDVRSGSETGLLRHLSPLNSQLGRGPQTRRSCRLSAIGLGSSYRRM
jgi:hypothetical protein